ncbi:uncharacterized protein K489DRAFT_196299 [Dissoconium aciculare CBS 342.82]|uniref:Uncharacterized protein n=1 Tax=Dissoconium aciculare CBS 342.82 TaxID=1314786 RepID=A0A6J3M9G0_9PEZI|nr:uncharacterized protein K489DRAFT_196299 [Dissoconium aciculare CBS 342.82]KAF1823447.1 hypothetical protein K489DRAFT_196299 [Dissoconium aciculare CBS 342.82]
MFCGVATLCHFAFAHGPESWLYGKGRPSFRPSRAVNNHSRDEQSLGWGRSSSSSRHNMFTSVDYGGGSSLSYQLLFYSLVTRRNPSSPHRCKA